MTTRLTRVLRAVCATPWAIQPEKLDAITELLELRASGGTFTREEVQARIGSRDGTRAESAGGIAVLPLFGVIAHRMNLMTEISGGTSTEQFAQWFDAALADPTVSAIVLDVDSPGGTVEGVEELAAKIYAARGQKRIVAHANSLAASAAYWIASAADELVVTPSGVVGSIGVFTVHTDVSGADERLGIKRTLIRAGKYKAEDLPFEPLDDAAKAARQQEVDDVYATFVRAVATYRGVSVDEVTSGYGEGRALRARRALAAGMVDRIATLDDVLVGLAGRSTARSRPAARASRTLPIAASTHLGSQAEVTTDLESELLLAALERGREAPAPRRVALAAAPTTAVGDAVCTCGHDQDLHAEGGGPCEAEGCDCPGYEPGTDPSDTEATAAAAAAATPAPNTTQEGPDSRAMQDSPAPEAKEQAMPEKIAAQDGADAGKMVESREQKLAALAEIHGAHSRLPAWIKDGLEPESPRVQADIKEFYRIREKEIRTGVPILTGGEPNETKRPWGSFGEQLRAVQGAFSPGGEDKLDPRLFAAASGMSQAIPSEGGFTVAPQFSQLIWDGLSQDPNSLLGMADSYPVDGESLTFNANAETSRATGSRFGGVQGYWINEADQITKSKPKFRQAKVEPQQLAVLVYLTEKLLRNSTAALESYVTKAAGEEINFLVGDAIVNGDGVGKPKGIMASGCLVTVNKETSQAAATLNKKNANKMWARLHPRSRRTAVWLYNVDVEPQFDDFNTVVMNVAGTENVGGFGSMIYNADKNTLKGRPLIPCEFCQTLGTVGDILLADMTAYLAGVRGGGAGSIQTAMSMHVRFEYAEQAFRFMFEVDGQPWLASALTPFKGSNTLSTFVALQTR